MIRRLIILLLIVGCVFGDTIVYKRLLLGEWEDETLKKVTVDKIEDGAVWYTQKLLFTTITETISCNKIIQILNSNGEEVYLDCRMLPQNPPQKNNKTTPPSNPSIESNSISKSKLKQAGNHLVQFRKDYYTGFMVSMLGNVATLYGASENKGDIILYGGVASLLGGILMLISFDSAGEAGEDLIDAGEKLETEQDTSNP